VKRTISVAHTYYVCIDGGQTKTSVSVLDEDGACLSTWEADPLPTPSKPGALEGCAPLSAASARS
jgi:N-acetylglucosamine kinase-like BadF-type ATPase